MIEEYKTITRHSAPSTLDEAEYGTRCEVIVDDTVEIYIQFSTNAEEPKWQFMGTRDKDKEQEIRINK